MPRNTRWLRSTLVACALAGTPLAAQSPVERLEDPRRLVPLLDFGVTRGFPATLASRDASALVPQATSSALHREVSRLRLNAQWGLIAEGRLPLGAARHWGIEAYGSRFKGNAVGTFETTDSLVTTPLATASDFRRYSLRGVTSWRGTLGVAHVVPLPARLTGTVFLGGTVGSIRSKGTDCTTIQTPNGTACTPIAPLRLHTPGFTPGGDVMTPSWHRFRFRLGAKADVLSIDEAEVRRSLKPATLTTAPVGEGGRVWRTLPSWTLGIEYLFVF